MPVKAGQAVVEVRELMLKSDTAAQRTARTLAHNRVWGDLAPSARTPLREIADQGHGAWKDDHFQARGESVAHRAGNGAFLCRMGQADGTFGPWPISAERNRSALCIYS